MFESCSNAEFIQHLLQWCVMMGGAREHKGISQQCEIFYLKGIFTCQEVDRNVS